MARPGRLNVDDYLTSSADRAMLLDFAKEKSSQENIKFLIAVDHFKAEMKRLAEEIFKQFLHEESPDTVNVTYAENEKVRTDLKNCNLHYNMFNAARNSIATIFTQDCFYTFDGWMDSKAQKEMRATIDDMKASTKKGGITTTIGRITKKPGLLNFSTSSGDSGPGKNIVPKDERVSQTPLQDKANLLQKFYSNVAIKDRKHSGKKYPNCFTGADALEWLCSQNMKREDSLPQLQAWLEAGVFFGTNVLDFQDNSHAFYRFAVHEELDDGISKRPSKEQLGRTTLTPPSTFPAVSFQKPEEIEAKTTNADTHEPTEKPPSITTIDIPPKEDNRGRMTKSHKFSGSKDVSPSPRKHRAGSVHNHPQPLLQHGSFPVAVYASLLEARKNSIKAAELAEQAAAMTRKVEEAIAAALKSYPELLNESSAGKEDLANNEVIPALVPRLNLQQTKEKIEKEDS